MAHIEVREVLKPGDVAPCITLDAATREGRVSTDDFRGEKPLLIGMFRGLHCPFCRRHLATQAAIDRELREKGVECLAIVSTPVERARLFFRYHPMPDLLVASDPERASHRAFGLRNIDQSVFQLGVKGAVTTGLNLWDRYNMTNVDWEMMSEASGQLFGQFLIDREGIVRWAFAEAPDEGRPMMARPAPAELIEAAVSLAA